MDRNEKRMKSTMPQQRLKKHRADKGLREFGAPNKLPARLTRKYSECPTFFSRKPVMPQPKKVRSKMKWIYFY